jgi:hypothetical protein
MREDNEVEYENKLMLLEPVVRQLSRKSHIIWVSQTPIIQTCCNSKNSDGIYKAFSQNKLDIYNNIARRVLQ